MTNENVFEIEVEEEESTITEARQTPLPAEEYPSTEEAPATVEDQKPSEAPQSALAPAPEKPKGVLDDPYDYDKCTITASIVWLPGELGARDVMIGVRNHLDAPILKVFNERDLPSEEIMEVIQEMTNDLREELPDRYAEKLERDKKKPAVTARPSKAPAPKPSTTLTPASASKPAAQTGKKPVGKAPDPAQKSFFDLFTGGK